MNNERFNKLLSIGVVTIVSIIVCSIVVNGIIDEQLMSIESKNTCKIVMAFVVAVLYTISTILLIKKTDKIDSIKKKEPTDGYNKGLQEGKK